MQVQIQMNIHFEQILIVEITDPLAHSPPANSPWINLKTISNTGATIPTVCKVGSKPVTNVTVENPIIVITIVFFLPCLHRSKSGNWKRI